MSATTLTGIVKQVQSGDTIVIRDKPKNKSPNVKTIILMGITAPKLGRKKKEGFEEKDEPFAWDAREFLRKKLIGQEVNFFSKPFPNASGSSDRELGKIFFPTKDDDITEELVANGLAKVKREKASGKQAQEPDVEKLFELQKKAEAEGKGIYGKDKDKHVRSVKYPKDYSSLVKDFKKEPVNAIIEAVRTGQYMIILDVILLPSYHSFPLAINGIKFNPEVEEFKEQTRFFVECRLLQQDDVQIVIEKAMNNFAAGSVLHPKGNIAELLLKEGFMCCDDRTIVTVASGAPKLRAAEKLAKDKKLRVWKNAEISSVPKEPKKEFQGTVCEIIGGEALMVKLSNTSEVKKIFLSSIRSPKEPATPKKDDGDEIIPKDKPDKRGPPRTIFDVPWLFEAREFLRKKLIGKRVNIIEDYVQGARDSFPERSCCTVMIGGNNIAEQLVLNGLATVIRHRERDDRSSHYDALQAAEIKAMDSKKGLHCKDNSPRHRVTDCTGNRATGLFPMLQKADRIEGVVEYVMSGSRMRIYIPKDSLMITFLLSGIQCPRAATKSQGLAQQDAEPFGEEALCHTKEKVLQREVEIRIESHDRRGCMLGTLFVKDANNKDISLAVSLVEKGLAEVYSSCSDRVLITTEKEVKEKKIGIWSIRQEEHKNKSEDDVPDRKVDYKDVSLSIVSPDLHILVHHIDERKALQELEEKFRQEFSSNPPITFSKENPPQKSKWVAAKFSDDLWYRAKVEKVMGGSTCKAQVYFADYGNRSLVPFDELAPLPEVYATAKPFAHEYALACVTMPPEHYLDEVALELVREISDRTLGLNIEYYDHNLAFVTLIDKETKEDVIKTCIEKGLFYVQRRRERKLQSLIKEYDESEAKAKKERALIWEYGDAREDDAKEFGLGK